MFSFPTLLSMIFDGDGLFFVFFSCFFFFLVGWLVFGSLKPQLSCVLWVLPAS